MPKWKLVRRTLTPMLFVRLYNLWKHRAAISGKAEVDLASTTSWGRGCVISTFTKIKISGRSKVDVGGGDGLASAFR
jgi:hypothetical protein